MTRTLLTVLALPLLLAACVEDLDPNTGEDDVTDDSGGEERPDPDEDLDEDDSRGTVTVDGDEVTAELVATDADAWIHLDMDEPAILLDGEDTWSLRFSRYTVEVNGGVSGDGGVEVAFTDDDYDTVTAAPTDGWFTDQPDGDDDDEDPDRAFDTWWDYDSSTHVLTPAEGTWFVRSVGGQTYALVFIDYYSDAGDSGYPSIRYRPVADGAE